MSKPIILTTDDEIEVGNAIERDLRKQFGKDYRIIKTTSGKEALDTIRQLKQRNDQIALFLTDQRMPEMEGTDFLEEAMKLYPEARKVLPASAGRSPTRAVRSPAGAPTIVREL